ncbi:hypothetical protein SEEM41H_14014, partial [Salmonella enterica subsp. enterica serovar Montevideo str. 4441 H]
MPELDGLSPLARGTRGADYDFPIIYRFIPAGAGNTVPMRGIWGVLPVYPRWRGEHFRIKQNILYIFGLSPLARGTRKRDGTKTCRTRFIPAGAGYTFQRSRSRSAHT